MITTLIFDLNDMLVRGLTGVEETLCQMVDSPKETILERLWDNAMLGFLLGETSEAEYLTKVIYFTVESKFTPVPASRGWCAPVPIHVGMGSPLP